MLNLVADGVEERVELAARDGAVIVAVKGVEALLEIRDLFGGEITRGSLVVVVVIVR